MLLPLCERDGPIVRHITAVWMGQAACDWLAQHTGRLHAGTALALQLSNLRAHGGEIHAHVQTCALAPARWPSRRAGQPAAPQPMHTRWPTTRLTHRHPMPEPIVPIDRLQTEATAAARQYADVNDACPYPFSSAAGQLFAGFSPHAPHAPPNPTPNPHPRRPRTMTANNTNQH